MTKKKKTEPAKKAESAYSRFYPPVKKDWPEKKSSKKVGDYFKEAKKNVDSEDKGGTDEGNKQAGETK